MRVPDEWPSIPPRREDRTRLTGKLVMFVMAGPWKSRGPAFPLVWSGKVLMYVTQRYKVTYMEKTQVYLPKEELEALREAARRSGRSVADLVREAIRKTVLKPRPSGPVALWEGTPKRSSSEHDSIYDES
jgi:hypothetical protein